MTVAAPVSVPSRASTPRPKPPTPAGHESRPSATGRRLNRVSPADPLSDRATSALVRRVLCQQQLRDKGRDAQPPIEELLPPLTSRNDVDLQLYAFLAIILREFVQSWYGKITSDETFVAEIVHIIAHCTRALEQRFRKLDLESLVLDEIPHLLDQHVDAYRTAHRPVSRPLLEVDPREAYHSLFPLPQLSPVPRLDDPSTVSEQRDNEAAYRQLLVQAVLAVLLPTEDLENPCLTTLLGQILSELVIGNVIANKAAQPWLLWEGICILARVLGERKANAAGAIVTAPVPLATDVAPKSGRDWSVRGIFLSMIQLGILFIALIRFIATTLIMTSSLPPRISPDDEKEWTSAHMGAEKARAGHATATSAKVAVLDFTIWGCAADLLEVGSRMPWLAGFMSLLQYGAVSGPGRVAGLDGPLDRLFSHHIRSLFSPSHLPPLLRTLRGVLFPNNAPGTPTLFPPSSDAELHALRRRAANALWNLLPKGVGRLYFGGRWWRRGSGDDDTEEQRMVDELEQMLMVSSDEYCNKHLMYSVLELILVKLMPELSEKGPAELWDERLG